MGKQFTGGRFTANVSKVLKGADRIICQMTDGGDILVTDGSILFSMNQFEFDVLARPVCCCDPGNWIIQNGKREESTCKLEKIFEDTARGLKEGSKIDRGGIGECKVTGDEDEPIRPTERYWTWDGTAVSPY